MSYNTGASWLLTYMINAASSSHCADLENGSFPQCWCQCTNFGALFGLANKLHKICNRLPWAQCQQRGVTISALASVACSTLTAHCAILLYLTYMHQRFHDALCLQLKLNTAELHYICLPFVTGTGMTSWHLMAATLLLNLLAFLPGASSGARNWREGVSAHTGHERFQAWQTLGLRQVWAICRHTNLQRRRCQQYNILWLGCCAFTAWCRHLNRRCCDSQVITAKGTVTGW